MICPKCKKELPDGSAFCNHCGTAINVQPTPQQSQPQKTMQQIGAEAELKKLESKPWKLIYILTSIGGIIIITLSILPALMYADSEIIMVGMIIGIALLVYGIFQFINVYERIKQLKPLANGRRLVNVCPKCKSPRIQMHLVQTNSVTAHGTTRVANNVNPLHPFTHTNIKQGNDYTSARYGNMMICLNCGCTFTEPDRFYM